MGVQHLVTLQLAQITHVANIAETEVMVGAPLAGPVSNSLCSLLRLRLRLRLALVEDDFVFVGTVVLVEFISRD